MFLLCVYCRQGSLKILGQFQAAFLCSGMTAFKSGIGLAKLSGCL